MVLCSGLRGLGEWGWVWLVGSARLAKIALGAEVGLGLEHEDKPGLEPELELELELELGLGLERELGLEPETGLEPDLELCCLAAS